MSGNITRRGKTSWQLKFDLPSDDGTRRTRYATVRGTYKDAQKELTRLLNARDEGVLSDPTSATVADYLTHWLDTKRGLSLKTLERYRELAERQIIPLLARQKFRSLKPSMLRNGTETSSQKDCLLELLGTPIVFCGWSCRGQLKTTR